MSGKIFLRIGPFRRYRATVEIYEFPENPASSHSAHLSIRKNMQKLKKSLQRIMRKLRTDEQTWLNLQTGPPPRVGGSKNCLLKIGDKTGQNIRSGV